MGGVLDGFVSWVLDQYLIDVGYIGPAYTWNHGREVATRRSARVDRALCDDVWR